MIPKQEQKERHRWVVGSGRWEPAKYTRVGVTGGGGVVHPLLPAPAPAPPGQVAALTVDSAEQLPVREAGRRPDT